MSGTETSSPKSHEGPEESIGLVGVGYVGLPVALAFARRGFHVIGYDTNPAHVAALQNGDPEVVTATADELLEALNVGSFEPTTDVSRLDHCGAFIICVPTPLDPGGTPDLSALQAAARMVAQHVQPGVTVVLESTSYPGTTRDIFLPLLEQRLGQVGQDFCLGFVPERIDPGNATYRLENTPRIVGGVTATCTDRILTLYEHVVPQCYPVSSPEAAETAKLLENSFRNINIAWVNELMRFCDEAGLDVDEVIRAAATKPFGFMAFWPGPGVGGECIPVDPRYLTWRARRARSPLHLLERALDTNDWQPFYAVQQIQYVLQQSTRPASEALVLLIGVAYKPNVADVRNAPALVIMERLVRCGIRVVYHDPYVSSVDINGEFRHSVSLSDDLLHEVDLAVMVTEHANIDREYITRETPRFLDLTHGD